MISTHGDSIGKAARKANSPQAALILPTADTAYRSAVEGRVHVVDVFLVQLILGQPQPLAEAINLSKCHQTLVPQGKNRDMEGASARSISCQERGSEGIYIGL